MRNPGTRTFTLPTMLAAALASYSPSPAFADEAAVAAADPAPAVEPTLEAAAAPGTMDAPAPLAARPPPYALPWQLRPIAPGNAVRSDTAIATYATPAGSGSTVASTFLAAYKVSTTVAPLVRVAAVRDSAPGGGDAATLANPLFGIAWGKPLAPGVKLGLFGAVTLPVGSGGGDAPDLMRASAQRSAMAARSAMDNAMFAVNDLTLIGGAGLAYVAGGFTVQGEVTVLQLNRVRGLDAQPDAHKTNFTSGVFAGYFPISWLSVGGELRYQRWLSTPKAVASDTTGTLRDNVTAAAGVRGNFKLSGKRWLRPGLAYARALDDPMSGKGYDIIQIDVPFVF